MSTTKKQIKLPIAYVMRYVFSLIGFLYIVLFTVRGISSIISTIVINHEGIGKLLTGALAENHTEQITLYNNIVDTLKNTSVYGLDLALGIFNFLIIFHGVIGVGYVLTTNFKSKKMTREKAMFYLQIVSAAGAMFVIIALMMFLGGKIGHMRLFAVLDVLIIVLGGYHLGKGFFNACITLGISISHRSMVIVKVLSWIAAIISLVQIIILFI